MDPDPTLKAVALWTNRARGVTEESARECLEYSAVDIANIRWLVVYLKTALIGADETSNNSEFGVRNNGR